MTAWKLIAQAGEWALIEGHDGKIYRVSIPTGYADEVRGLPAHRNGHQVTLQELPKAPPPPPPVPDGAASPAIRTTDGAA